MEVRYYVGRAEHSCCYEATVRDHDGCVVCECFKREVAERICKLLNEEETQK